MSAQNSTRATTVLFPGSAELITVQEEGNLSFPSTEVFVGARAVGGQLGPKLLIEQWSTLVYCARPCSEQFLVSMHQHHERDRC